MWLIMMDGSGCACARACGHASTHHCVEKRPLSHDQCACGLCKNPCIGEPQVAGLFRAVATLCWACCAAATAAGACLSRRFQRLVLLPTAYVSGACAGSSHRWMVAPLCLRARHPRFSPRPLAAPRYSSTVKHARASSNRDIGCRSISATSGQRCGWRIPRWMCLRKRLLTQGASIL